MPETKSETISETISETSAVEAAYARRIADGALDPDPAQAALVARFADLERRLAAAKRGRGLLSRLFGSTPEPVRGLYVWGGVGRGKSMLMDLFFAHAPVAAKRRVHFHAFMADVHDRLHAARTRALADEAEAEDPIVPVADALAAEARLLCFDEFFVSDITDAMILGRLFTRLFEAGVTVVATSNIAPDGLYAGGLNRALFTPFIALLKRRTEVVALDEGVDYRLDGLRDLAVWHVRGAAEDAADDAIDRLWSALPPAPAPRDLTVKGRTLRLPCAKTSEAGRAARMTFDEAARAALGPNDFLALADALDLVAITDVPVLGSAERDAARRFTSLVDALYEAGAALVVSAAAEPAALVPGGKEAFAFKRTASRLEEMRSADYLSASKARSLLEAARGALA